MATANLVRLKPAKKQQRTMAAPFMPHRQVEEKADRAEESLLGHVRGGS